MKHTMNLTAVVDGTPEGLYTAVYKYYYENLRPSLVVDGSLQCFQQALGAEYVFIETDFTMAEKVFNAIFLEKESKLTDLTRSRILHAFLSASECKMFDIYRYILLAFKEPRSADHREQLDFVINVRLMARNVGREAHLLNGFTRFRQTADNVLYAEISPKNNVLHLVCEHFTDRLGGERFVIHDVKRGLAGVYDTEDCVILEVPVGLQTSFAESEDEQKWQEMWTIFYNTLAIQERGNSGLRRQLSPKYFWKHMTEHLRRMPWQ